MLSRYHSQEGAIFTNGGHSERDRRPGLCYGVEGGGHALDAQQKQAAIRQSTLPFRWCSTRWRPRSQWTWASMWSCQWRSAARLAVSPSHGHSVHSAYQALSTSGWSQDCTPANVHRLYFLSRTLLQIYVCICSPSEHEMPDPPRSVSLFVCLSATIVDFTTHGIVISEFLSTCNTQPICRDQCKLFSTASTARLPRGTRYRRLAYLF